MHYIQARFFLKAVLYSSFQGLGANISGSDCCYMVVFQYGSIVLFNVREHDVDGYLKIVEKHASGLLPEMRKDGEFRHLYVIWLLFYEYFVPIKSPLRNERGELKTDRHRQLESLGNWYSLSVLESHSLCSIDIKTDLI